MLENVFSFELVSVLINTEKVSFFSPSLWLHVYVSVCVLGINLPMCAHRGQLQTSKNASKM